MAARPALDSGVLVIFGAGGDLTFRKLIPALYRLFVTGHLPERFAVVGMQRPGKDEAAWREHLKQGVATFAGGAERWDEFEKLVHLHQGDFADTAAYHALANRIEALEKTWDGPANRVFYLAVPPWMFEPIVTQLHESGLSRAVREARVVIEKPFGRDLRSARELDRLLRSTFDERQIFRIDHYLGKETVQNILALRFANAIFEPIWDQKYIAEVQITVGETVGVEHRGAYYEHAGALRDMIQNHLMQLLCLVAMEPPVSFGAEEIRNKKVDVIRAIRPLTARDVHEHAVRGQYAAGWIAGQKVPGYRQEPGVAKDSFTETYAALRLFVDNWRWRGVPFYLRAGKRLPARVSEVSIVFRPVPHLAFPASAAADIRPNRLVLRLQPDEGVLLLLQAKKPGLSMRLAPMEMHFTYRENFQVGPPEAYETLLRDAMAGDATLFMRADQVETSWELLEPVLEAWGGGGEVPTYAAGTWGPEAADRFLAKQGSTWLPPTITD